MRRVKTAAANKKQKGFTLVELIVVIAILAILAVGAIVGFGRVRDTADEAVARANAGVIVSSLNTRNALAVSAIGLSELSDVDTRTELNSLLVLTAATGLVAIDLSVEASDSEIAAAMGFVDFQDGKFVVSP